MKFRSAAVIAVAAGVLVATAACSSGSGAGSGSGASGSSSTPAASKAASAKTWTADELPPLLQTAAKQVGVTGTVLDNAQVQSKISSAGGANGISSLLSQSGITISPASCKQIITDNLSTTPPAGTVNSMLTYGSNAVFVTTEAGKSLPASLTTDAQKKQEQALSECGSMKLSLTESGQTISIPLTIKKVDVSTDADQTYAYQETVTLPAAAGGTSTAIEIVSAISGNLVITSEAASGSTATASAVSPAAIINAVIAASKK
ncbi:hypothetical protein [Frondihabitans australicus]|uniref:Lipoprotein n=1 Tax=Frondihabitans australicus TaxID=386892 RepID=A0A495IHJ2_9MICO|nr:hypothetical protein [Frondihabitans australicus]RKR74928.1 hypothetical protein C8E83_2062 [Frondihabitans australicus]